MQAAPKPESPTAKNPVIERFRNWRRVAPMTSGSGGTQATGAAEPAVTSSLPAVCS